MLRAGGDSRISPFVATVTVPCFNLFQWSFWSLRTFLENRSVRLRADLSSNVCCLIIPEIAMDLFNLICFQDRTFLVLKVRSAWPKIYNFPISLPISSPFLLMAFSVSFFPLYRDLIAFFLSKWGEEREENFLTLDRLWSLPSAISEEKPICTWHRDDTVTVVKSFYASKNFFQARVEKNMCVHPETSLQRHSISTGYFLCWKRIFLFPSYLQKLKSNISI